MKESIPYFDRFKESSLKDEPKGESPFARNLMLSSLIKFL